MNLHTTDASMIFVTLLLALVAVMAVVLWLGSRLSRGIDRLLAARSREPLGRIRPSLGLSPPVGETKPRLDASLLYGGRDGPKYFSQLRKFFA